MSDPHLPASSKTFGEDTNVVTHGPQESGRSPQFQNEYDDSFRDKLGDCEISDDRVSPEEAGLLNNLITGIRYFALAVSMAIWAAVGFFLWIPMLVYSIVHFSALVAYATITNADPSALASKLERSVRFYLQGFRNIVKAFYRRSYQADSQEILQIDANMVARHILSTLAFWFVLFALYLSANGTVGRWIGQFEK